MVRIVRNLIESPLGSFKCFARFSVPTLFSFDLELMCDLYRNKDSKHHARLSNAYLKKKTPWTLLSGLDIDEWDTSVEWTLFLSHSSTDSWEQSSFPFCGGLKSLRTVLNLMVEEVVTQATTVSLLVLDLSILSSLMFEILINEIIKTLQKAKRKIIPVETSARGCSCYQFSFLGCVS